MKVNVLKSIENIAQMYEDGVFGSKELPEDTIHILLKILKKMHCILLCQQHLTISEIRILYG